MRALTGSDVSSPTSCSRRSTRRCARCIPRQSRASSSPTRSASSRSCRTISSPRSARRSTRRSRRRCCSTSSTPPIRRAEAQLEVTREVLARDRRRVGPEPAPAQQDRSPRPGGAGGAGRAPSRRRSPVGARCRRRGGAAPAHHRVLRERHGRRSARSSPMPAKAWLATSTTTRASSPRPSTRADGIWSCGPCRRRWRSCAARSGAEPQLCDHVVKLSGVRLMVRSTRMAAVEFARER